MASRSSRGASRQTNTGTAGGLVNMGSPPLHEFHRTATQLKSNNQREDLSSERKSSRNHTPDHFLKSNNDQYNLSLHGSTHQNRNLHFSQTGFSSTVFNHNVLESHDDALRHYLNPSVIHYSPSKALKEIAENTHEITPDDSTILGGGKANSSAIKVRFSEAVN